MVLEVRTGGIGKGEENPRWTGSVSSFHGGPSLGPVGTPNETHNRKRLLNIST